MDSELLTPAIPTEPPRRLAPDEVIDGYRVRWRIGAGAMGEVYLAIDEQLGRKVALKLIRSADLDQAATGRFLAEARTTARFNHPHIVTVHDSGLYLGRPYLVLEFLDGGSLRQRLERGPLPPREALRLGRAVAEALKVAHGEGVVHADLKPENVIIPRDGRPRVVDFGLARLVGTSPAGTSGTPAYMAPERWAASPPAPPMDVWALGVLLCEALDGQRPFSDAELARLLFSDRPLALGKVSGGGPWADLLRRCLARAPGDRPTAEEVALELEALLAGKAGDEGRSPFRGLEAFTEADAQDFHGRDADVEAVVERLRSEGLVPVVGPSGVGKSSFLQAGVIHRLRDLGPQQVVACRPGRLPLTSVLAALQAQGLPAGAEPVLAARSSPGFLVRALRELARLREARIVLVLDQFEEAVTLGDPAEREQLLAALAAATVPDEAFRVLLALRSDFLGAFAETALQPCLGAVSVLRPLSAAALAQAFRGPLRRVGFRPDEDELPLRMAREAHGEAAALPLLQFAADALWRRRDAGRRLVLTREYEAMGGATGALATHAERLALELGPSERGHVRRLLLYLVTVDGTRRPRTREELLAHAGADAAPALERLLANRLLVSGQDEGSGQALVELAHESLTTTWPALARWLAESQDSRRLEHELEQAAGLWASRGRSPGETWTGTPLRDALHHLEQWRLSPGPLEREFLAAGEAEQRRRERRRKVLLASAFAGLTVLLVAAATAAVVFRDKQQQALAQQEEIRKAAADMGRFALVLAPFDWDPEAAEARPVDAAGLEGLTVRFHEGSPEEPGGPVDPTYLVRGTPALAQDGGLTEEVELRARPTWLEVEGRGRGGEACGASWVFARALPGYAERDAGRTVTVPVPTCQASRADTVEVPGGPYEVLDQRTGQYREVDLPTYRLDAHEVTREAYGVYQGMSPLTGDRVAALPAHLDPTRRRLPMVQLDADQSERYCRFLGKRLQSADEWRKAARGGLWLDAAHTVRNPSPRRPTPWGTLDPRLANLARPGVPHRFLPVGSFPADRGPSGAEDLIGSAMEWTRDRAQEGDRYEGLRVTVGGDWWEEEVTQAQVFAIDVVNSRLEYYRDLALAPRCSSD